MMENNNMITRKKEKSFNVPLLSGPAGFTHIEAVKTWV
jgi:hypothetical protein